MGKDGSEETMNTNNDALEATACSVRQIHYHYKDTMGLRYVPSAVAYHNLDINCVCRADLIVTCKVAIGV